MSNSLDSKLDDNQLESGSKSERLSEESKDQNLKSANDIIRNMKMKSVKSFDRGFEDYNDEDEDDDKDDRQKKGNIGIERARAEEEKE